MKIPMLDLKGQYESVKQDIYLRTSQVLTHQKFILGPEVQELEAKIAKYCNTDYAVGVSSGTDALLMSLMALEIGQGDLVITTPYTFFATAGSISRLKATPVFVDVDPNTFNISPECIEEKLNKMTHFDRRRVKAIIPVHLFGQCCDMDRIMKIAGDNNITVIEDACQSIGSDWKGAPAGSLGHFGCFSFFPSKNLGCFGDGGMITTNDPEMDKKLRILRVHGSNPKYHHSMIGGNFRLDTIQASVVLAKMKYLNKWTKKRQENARRYNELFADAGLKEHVIVPTKNEYGHVYNQYVLKVNHRDELQAYLKEKGISTAVYYPVPLHLQKCFSYLYEKGDFLMSEVLANCSLAIPTYPELLESEQKFIVDMIKKFYLL